jgi:hypothetical protein
MAVVTELDTLCQELAVNWTERDMAELELELAPYIAAVRRHLASKHAIPSHVPGAGSICVPITSITDPEELYREAAGTVSQEQFEVEEFADYWITTHYSTVPVVILLLKQKCEPLEKLADLCLRCSNALGAPVGGNCYFQWNTPGFWWKLHTDDEYEGVSSRVHVPFITTPQNVFAWAPTLDAPRPQWLLERHLERGKVYVTRTDVPHTAMNEHPTDGRLHLIIDVGSSPASP